MAVQHLFLWRIDLQTLILKFCDNITDFEKFWYNQQMALGNRTYYKEAATFSEESCQASC